MGAHEPVRNEEVAGQDTDLSCEDTLFEAVRWAVGETTPTPTGMLDVDGREWVVFRVERDGRTGTFAASLGGGKLTLGACAGEKASEQLKPALALACQSQCAPESL